MVILGYITIQKKDSVNSSQWFGKLTTVMLYAVMMLLILLPDIPLWTANCMIVVCGIVMLLSFFGYARFYRKLFAQTHEQWY